MNQIDATKRRGAVGLMMTEYLPVHEVAVGVYRVTVPIPFRGLSAVNCYLLHGDNGWTLVDTGLGTPEALAVWDVVFEALRIAPEDLEKIVLTHHHPDHMGLAGTFQRRAEAAGRKMPVFLSVREEEILDLIWGDREGREEVLRDFFARCGVPDPDGFSFQPREAVGMRCLLTPFPARYEPIALDAEIRLGDRTCCVLHTPGHSDGHLAFYDPSGRLLLVGDHVLPDITPNIALWPDVEPDPLGRYLASLAALRSLDVRLALPGHGGVIERWSDRVVTLGAHHAERLTFMAGLVGSRATVYEVAGNAFPLDRLDRHQARFALTETLSHLEHLVTERRLEKEEEGGVWIYREGVAARASASYFPAH